MEVPERLYGLSSAEALQRLHDELTAEIRLYEGKTKFSSFSQRFASTFLHHNRVESVFHWTSFAAIAVQVILLIIAYSNQPYRDTWLIVEAIFLFILLVINIYLLAYDDNLRKKEHVVKAKKVLKSIRNCIKEQRPIWNPSNYINLHAPLSPCVSLQWTVRDGELVNLPCGLLVAGDVIYMRPGQIVPCRCKSFQPEAVIIDDQVLEANDVYNPSSSEFNRSGPGPTLKRPYRPQPYIVLQTPFLNNIRSILEEAQHRPSSLLNNERFYITSVILERKIMPLVFAIFLLVNLVRYLCLPDDVGHWTEMGIVLQVHAILPFLPLVSPLLWRLLDIYGMAKVLAMFNKCLKQMPLKENVLESDAYLTGEMTLGSKHTEKNPDFDGETIFAKEALGSSPLEETIRHFRDVLYGYSDCLPRTSNIVHVLGNTTSFCCVDKKGILSWPNPTAEKVFFLRGADPDDSLSTGQNDTDSGNEEPPNEGCRDAKRKGVQGDVHFEVLDLTQDPKSGYKLNFDDPNWKKHLSSLKPMGLNILLDTCNIETVERYTEFADHVTSASLLRESAVPVVNRRCFCELSRQIGFSDPAMDIFELQEMLGLYRHLPSDTNTSNTGNTSKAGLSRGKSFIKYKMPMPHMFSVVVKETTSGSLQLFSQGTGDLLLNTCSDYWDGYDLCPLSSAERKKIADFYHRTSMSSYCTAFSYRPLIQGFGEEFGNAFLELPEHTLNFMNNPLRSPSPLRSWELDDAEKKCYHGSADSLITGTSIGSIHDLDSCFALQCSQVFIGMITMQYQAKQDIVQLIEELESACIRFVHFSKENELRSRVFSEKMGLEAGWNCHISLLSDSQDQSSAQLTANDEVSRRPSTVESVPEGGAVLLREKKNSDGCLKSARRLSAPGCINAEVSQVKFEATMPTILSPIDPMVEPVLSFHVGDLHDATVIQMDGSPNICTADTIEAEHDLTTALLEHDEDTESIGKKQHAGSIKSTPNIKATLSQRPSFNETLKTDYSQPLLGKTRSDGMLTPMRGSSKELYTDNISVESYPASSYVTENTDSVTGGLGLSNRAKLPKGIENIRPHIAHVDNVPLLVNLFTDCTPATTREMLSILQENGEVVCCMGSSANLNGTEIFLQADCSFAVEPLYPQICVRDPIISKPWADSDPTPMELNAMLHAIPCSLAFTRDDKISNIQLIAVARHHCQSVRQTFLLYLMLQMCLVLTQVLCGIVLLPPLLSAHHVIWLSVIVVPFLSVTLMANSADPDIVKQAQGKNRNQIPWKTMVEYIMYFMMRFVGTILVCLLTHVLNLNSFCENYVIHQNSTCHILLGDRNIQEKGTWNGWSSDYLSGLTLSQNLIVLQLVIFFICHSMCYVQRLHHIWVRPPHHNKHWCIVAVVLFVIQVIYCICDSSRENAFHPVLWKNIPITSWVLLFAWPVFIVVIMEAVKRREIKFSVRYQKRARLDFGTKLGMNSPF